VQIFRNGFLRRCFPLSLKLTARSLDVTASKCFFHRPRASARCTTSAAGDVRFGTIIFVALATVCLALGQQAPAFKSPGVNADAVIIGDFDKQVHEYVKLHKKAEAGLPRMKPTDSPEIITERRHMLASRIQTARQQAKQGDLFSPQVSQLYKRLIAMAYQASGPAKVGTSLRHDEPVHELKLQVNAVYPERVPLQTTPPSILTNLPPLPPARLPNCRAESGVERHRSQYHR
jgi:hypothetical protein